jgi:hypothetical protein
VRSEHWCCGHGWEWRLGTGCPAMGSCRLVLIALCELSCRSTVLRGQLCLSGVRSGGCAGIWWECEPCSSTAASPDECSCSAGCSAGLCRY